MLAILFVMILQQVCSLPKLFKILPNDIIKDKKSTGKG